MLIPKDKGLRVSRSGETLVMEFNHDWAMATMPAIFGALFTLCLVIIAFSPSESYPSRPLPDYPFLVAAILLAAFTMTLFWTMWTWRTTIKADRGGLTVKASYFTRWFNFHTKYVPVQFYLKGSVRASSGTAYVSFYCLNPDEQEVRLSRSIPNLTMARQIWTLLQDYYDLPDLEVLGELEHEKLAEGRAKRRAEDRG